MSVVRIPNITDLGRHFKPGRDSSNVNHLAPVVSHGYSAQINVYTCTSYLVTVGDALYSTSQLNDLHTEHRINLLPFTTNDEVSTYMKKTLEKKTTKKNHVLPNTHWATFLPTS